MRVDLRSIDHVDGLHRQCCQPLLSGGCVVRQSGVHSGAPDGDSGFGQVATDERVGAWRRGAGVGAAAAARCAGSSRIFRRSERYYFLEERYPTYGNLVPRDIATREIFDVCVNEGLSVEADRQCVYLDLTHISRSELDRKLGGIMEIYEKFQGVDPREVPMKIFPAVHYSMGGLWVDYERRADGGLQLGSPRNQVTNVPRLYAIGECDYQYHGANRLGANSLLSCIFSGLIAAPGIASLAEFAKGRHRGGSISLAVRIGSRSPAVAS